MSIATMLAVIYRLRPVEDDSKLGWSEHTGRKNDRSNRMLVGQEFAKERRALAWSVGVATVAMALVGLIALNRP